MVFPLTTIQKHSHRGYFLTDIFHRAVSIKKPFTKKVVVFEHTEIRNSGEQESKI